MDEGLLKLNSLYSMSKIKGIISTESLLTKCREPLFNLFPVKKLGLFNFILKR